MFIFGAGDAFVTPNAGSTATAASPMQLYALQETSIDISNTTKSMMGKQQFPLAVARAEGKISVKVKFGAQYEKIWNDAFFGSAGVIAADSENGVARSAQTLTTHAVTITPPSSGVFARDMGVTSPNNGKLMYVVASNPVADVSYTISGSTYTFASGQTGAPLISYTYTATTGFQTTISNVAMGSQPIMDFTVMNAQYTNINGSVNCLVRLPAVIATKISLPFKYNDFEYTEMDLEAFANNAGIIAYISADE